MSIADKEMWRLVPSLTDYLASSHGRIMRLPFMGEMPHGGSRFYGGEPHYGQWDGSRYIHQYKGRTYKVHRMVCEAFNGPPPFDRAVVMHIDEDSRNNRISNLKWATQKENLNCPGFIEYCKGRTGENSPTVKAKRKRETA